MSYHKLSHVVWDCKYHLVILPKYHFKIFDAPLKITIKDEIKNFCRWPGDQHNSHNKTQQ